MDHNLIPLRFHHHAPLATGMIRHMGMKTVIEGVETELQKDMALRTGAEFIQGFYYAHPMPEEKLISFFGGAD